MASSVNNAPNTAAAVANTNTNANANAPVGSAALPPVVNRGAGGAGDAGGIGDVGGVVSSTGTTAGVTDASVVGNMSSVELRGRLDMVAKLPFDR